MAYTTPTTASGQVLTSAIWNASVRDNFAYIKARVDDPPRALVRHSTTQSIANATATALAFDTELYDPNGMHTASSTQLVIPTGETGYYLVTATVEFAANATGQRAVRIRTDANSTVARVSIDAAAAGATIVSVAGVFAMAAAAYFEVEVTQSSGGALNVAALPLFSAQRVA